MKQDILNKLKPYLAFEGKAYLMGTSKANDVIEEAPEGNNPPIIWAETDEEAQRMAKIHS